MAWNWVKQQVKLSYMLPIVQYTQEQESKHIRWHKNIVDGCQATFNIYIYFFLISERNPTRFIWVQFIFLQVLTSPGTLHNCSVWLQEVLSLSTLHTLEILSIFFTESDHIPLTDSVYTLQCPPVYCSVYDFHCLGPQELEIFGQRAYC